MSDPASASSLPIGQAILHLLAAGPQRLETLQTETGYSARWTYRVVAVLHREGHVRRLGKKGSTWWAAANYIGPLPARRPNPTVVARPRVLRPRPRPHPPAPADSWWTVPQGRDAFRQAAALRAHVMGWDK